MQVNCPNCGEVLVWGEKSVFRPFCSKQCKLIDLGLWEKEGYILTDAGGVCAVDLEQDDDFIAENNSKA